MVNSAQHWHRPDRHRRHFIGRSDARISMGLDEAALLRLWQEKRGEVEPERGRHSNGGNGDRGVIASRKRPRGIRDANGLPHGCRSRALLCRLP